MSKQKLLIGIDTGTDTGLGGWNPQTEKIEFIITTKIHKAMRFIEKLAKDFDIYLRVEDARQRKWFGHNSNAKKQGAGSIKRDAIIWEDYLNDLLKEGLIKGFKMIHPIRGATKIDAPTFNKLTGFKGTSSNHARDAFLMVYKLNHIQHN